MINRIIFLAITIYSFSFYNAQARPVLYKGAWSFIARNDENSCGGYIHYSPQTDRSLGFKSQYFKDRKYIVNNAQLNVLAKRWNKPFSQSNVYIKTGFGGAVSADDKKNVTTGVVLMSGFSADWENRRFFVSYETELLYAANIDLRYIQKGRLGIAPYIAEYGDLHTWVMAEIKYEPTRKNNNFMVTPLLRFFTGNILTEIGADYKGNVMFNWVMYF